MHRIYTLTGLASLILTLVLGGCDQRESRRAEVRLLELTAENKALRSENDSVKSILTRMENTRAGLLHQRVISKPAIFHEGGETLQSVRNRKILLCGGNADLPGFGYLSPDSGTFEGFDIDICRAIAAAVLGEKGAEQVEVIPLTSKLRFASLQSGRIDVLSRNTTWTLSRDTEFRTDYAGVTFYDGQGVLVRRASDIRKVSDLRGKAVCVQAGSTSASNILDHFESLGLTIELRDFQDRVAALKQYDEGGCDGYTGDKSSLIAQLSLLSNPEQHTVLIDDISREPLGPVVRHEDNNWKDIVAWTVQCLINAEALDVTRANVQERREQDSIAIRRLLGKDSNLGEKMGISNDFCYQIINQIGNYKDIYNRHLGPGSPFNLPRGLNALYTDGGILYPMPFK
jgi:general L-amino acid transport system substrate-binding protein